MIEKLRRSMLLVALVAVLLTLGLILPRFYGMLEQRAYNELKILVASLAQDMDQGQETDEYLARQQAALTGFRVTWIDRDGDVLYDGSTSDPDSLDNHADRPEVAQALREGEGADSRLSDSLGKNTFYYAMSLADGSILRVALTEDSLLSELASMVPMILLIAGAVLLLAFLMARGLARRMVRPLNDMDLDHPRENDVYAELTPLLVRIDQQNERIAGQLRESREEAQKITAITENMSEGMMLLSGQGHVLSMNSSAVSLMNATGFAYAGQHYLRVCRNLDLHRAVEAALRGEMAQCKLALQGRTYQALASPVRGGETGGAIVLFLDITERERAEATRREFSANVSHELKTPLTTIAGYAEMIQSGMSDAGDNQKLAATIHSEAQRLLSLIEDIIALSRLDETRELGKTEPVDLYALARSILSRMEPQAAARNVSLHLEGETAWVRGIPALLEEVLHNLVDNAIRYNVPEGEVLVTVQYAPEGPKVVVADTGIGIAPKDQDRVFERFYRVDKSHSRQTGGTGLGLSIVKHAVQAHGGKITLHSEPGKGTRIEVQFPEPEE